MNYIFLLFKEAFVSIFRHKLRSFFAIIGIMIGIAAVIVLVSLGKGVQKDVARTVEGVGTNLIVVLTGKIDTSQGGLSGGAGNPANFISSDILKREDVEAIAGIEKVKAAAPIALVSGAISANDKFASVTPAGSTPEIKDVFTGFKLKYGRFFDTNEADKNVMVAGESLRKQLFEDTENIVGEKVKLAKEEFEVVGQLEKPSGSGALLSSDFESIVIIPLDTAKRLNGDKDKFLRIGATVENAEDVKVAVEMIRQNMLKRHADDEFSVLTQDDLLGLFDSVINLLTTAVTAIGAISLIVGGIGISSVMFMSVADRTREIGIRKALGATGTLICLQFLIESVVLSILGGAFGLALALVVNEAVAQKTVIEPHLTSGVVILSVAFCTGVGVLFGLIPAIRASLKDPVEALREG